MVSPPTEFTWPDDPQDMTYVQKRTRGHNHPLIVLTKKDPVKARLEWIRLFERFAGNRVEVGKYLGLARDTVYYRVCRLNLWPEIKAIREKAAKVYGVKNHLKVGYIQMNINKDPRRTFMGTTDYRRQTL